MAVRDVVEDIRDKLKCPLCLDVPQDARVLTCGHTFCFTCIEQVHNRSHLTLGICPLCRESYFVKRGDIRNLPRNFQVNDVLDTLQSAGPGRPCAICQDGDGPYICLKCKLNMCDYCSKRDTNNCKHQVLSLDDMNSKPFLRDIIQRSKSKQTCPSHSAEDVSYFCETCKLVICNSCQLHHHHVTVGLKDSVKNLRAKDIPGLLAKKEREFDKTIESLSSGKRIDRIHQEIVQTEIKKIKLYRDECSDLHGDMCLLFQFGSDQTILELFHERENKIDELQSVPTISWQGKVRVIIQLMMTIVEYICLHQPRRTYAEANVTYTFVTLITFVELYFTIRFQLILFAIYGLVACIEFMTFSSNFNILATFSVVKTDAWKTLLFKRCRTSEGCHNTRFPNAIDILPLLFASLFA